jgi:hypothetical protein
LCSVAGCNHFWYSQHIANFILCHPAVAHVGQTNSYWVTCRGYGQEQGPPGSNVIVACRQIKWTKKDPARWNLCTSEMLIYIYIYIYIYIRYCEDFFRERKLLIRGQAIGQKQYTQQT